MYLKIYDKDFRLTITNTNFENHQDFWLEMK